MFAKKTYRKTRWLECALSLGIPTSDFEDQDGFGRFGVFDDDDIFLDDDDDWDLRDNVDEEEVFNGEPGPWLVVKPGYVVRIKRHRWTPIQYMRKAYGKENEPYLECARSIDSANGNSIMKIYKPKNSVGKKLIFVSRETSLAT